MLDRSMVTHTTGVLIVEDELIIARGIQKRLQNMGYHVTAIVPTGEEAVRSAVENRPDLILMDINLQGEMDGIEAAKEVRSRFDIPVIYLTAYTDSESLERAKLTEPFGYIVKPFQDQTLQSAIEMAIYKHGMESRLRKNEQWLATILSSIADAVVATDVTGLVTYLNPLAEALLGIGQEMALGRNLTELFHCRGEGGCPSAEDIIQRVAVEGETVTLPDDAVLVRESGEPVPIEARVSPIRGTGQSVWGLALVMRDGTERRRAEKALKRSERILALKNQIANIFLATPDEQMFGEVLDVVLKEMESKYGIFGYIDENGFLVIPSMSRDVWWECQMEGKSIHFPPEVWGGLWGRSLREQKSFIGNGPFSIPEGHVSITNFLTCPILYRGKTIGLLSAANRARDFDDTDRELLETIAGRIAPILQARLERDRQERKRRQAETALRHSERLLRSVFDAIPDLFAIIDRDHRIVLSNWGGGYGYVPEDRREGRPLCFEAYYGSGEPCAPCHVTDVFRTGQPVIREKFNPQVGYVEVRAFPVFDEDGVIFLVIENVRNITERKRAEEALAMEKERLAVTLRSIGDGVITADTEGRVVLLNKVAEEMTGWKQEDAAGRLFQDVFHIISEKTRERCQSPVDRVLATGTCIELANHTVLVSRDGTERIIADSGAPIRDRESRLVGVVLVFRDITVEKRIEEELFTSRRLESLGILAGGIAHDFNNLLTAILGNISLSKLYVSEGEKVHQKLCEAEKASLRARDLTQQLLTFSRGGAPVRKTATIAGIIRDSAAFTLSGSRVLCSFAISDDLYPVEVDEGQFSQVINNLIINAEQAMPEGGVVEVGASNVYVGERHSLPLRKGPYVLISISDRGPGIPDDIMPRIFDPYFTTKANGKGLGLATVYSIVKNHEGHISVTSRKGEGATFSIYLPAAVTGVVERKQEVVVAHVGNGKVLVMDDEESVRDVAGEMLSYLGYEVVFALDGREAVELYRRAVEEQRPFRAVLMDLTIPGGMGGRDAIALLRELDENVKAIVSSGYSNDPIMADYRAFGFSGVITKPYKVAELKRVLGEVLGQ